MEIIHTFVVLAYKESQDLERCIKSVLNQKYKSKVVVATSTPNKHINNLVKKYHLTLKINKNAKGRIGDDFDFAIKSSETKLVTIAHQDDVYDYDFSYEVLERFKNSPNSLIIFTDYYELRNNEKVFSNNNLKIKRILLFPLRLKFNSRFKWAKRFVIRFGNAIGCPTVTFNKEKVEFPIFDSDFKCNVDWNAWEKLSLQKGTFSFINKKLMGHTIDVSTTTTKIISEGIRTKEDLIMFKKFWPNSIAKFLNKFYKKSEKSNKLKGE